MNFFPFLLLSLVNCIAYYCFFYYLLFSIKNPVNLCRAAFILLILFSLAIVTCPIVLHLLGVTHMPFMKCSMHMPQMM